MGRKKKRDKQIIFCYYCDRIYENERVLIQHQRAKHFKCPQCHKRISTAQGMMVHMFQVHKETIEHVPGAKEGRDSFEVEIFGMDGVPAEVVEEKRIKVFGEAAKKKPRSSPQQSQLQPIAQPQAHEIKIPGTRNVFSIRPPGGAGVNPMMMMGMPGMPMYPGMPFPGIPQVLPPPMPLQMPTLQLRPPTIPPPMAISHIGGRVLVPQAARIIAPPPTVPPPRIAPPPAELLPEFPNIPPPQFDILSTLPTLANQNSAPNEPPPKLVLDQTTKPSKSRESLPQKHEDKPTISSTTKDPAEAKQEILLSVEKNSVNKDEILNKAHKNVTDQESKTKKLIEPKKSNQPERSNTETNTVDPQKTPLPPNEVSNQIESPQTVSESTKGSPLNRNTPPGVPPPKMVSSPIRPSANSTGMSSVSPRLSALLLPKPLQKPLSPISPKAIKYRCPAPGARKGRSPIIPVQTSSTGQPVGRYIPQVMVRGSNNPPSVPPQKLSQAPPIAGSLSKASKAASPKKKKATIRIFNEKDVSQEERRAMHPKYSGHLTKRIDSLSESIEERLKLLK